jgi:ligand-binding sensor domain-containing protein/signal transduction histidine kinase
MCARVLYGARPFWGIAGLAFVSFCGYDGLNQAHATDKTTLPEFLVRSWDNQDGLPSAAVRAIARTPDGYLWAGTEKGLARFDGARFVTLTTNNRPALGDNRISSLCVDGAGELWVGSQRGTLALRHKGIFEPAPLNERWQGVSISALAQLPDGVLWLATRGAGMARCRNGHYDFFTATNGLPSNDVSQLAADKQGTLWAIAGTALVRYGEQTTPQPPPLDGELVALAPSAHGGLWVATTFPQPLRNRGGRVFKLKDGRWEAELTPYLWPQDTVFARVTALLEDQDGRLWVGTPGAGLFYWEAGKWQRLAPEGPLAQLDCTCLAVDGEGTVWAGTTGGQLLQVRLRPVRTLHLPVTAEKNVLMNACVTHDGSVWVGTDGAGVFRYRDEQFDNYAEGQGLPSGHIGVILEDSRTNLWVGTWAGLFRREGERFQPVPGPAALRQVVLALCEDREGTMWAGTGGGVVRLGPHESKVYGQAEGVDHFYIRAITQDQQGRIWLAIMDRGLYLLQNERFARYGVGHWSGESRIRALHADAAGDLWIATFGSGLVRLRDGHFTQWSTSDGLPSDSLVSVTEDQSNNLWFSSEDGIFGCPKSRFNDYQRGVTPRLLFWHLSAAEGLETKKCSGAGQPAVGHSADGRLWFPDWRALAYFDPAEVPSVWSPWPILLEETVVDGQFQPAPRGVMRVMSSARNYEFRYTSPNLQAPERVRFRYQLKGSSPDWVEADQRRAAYYSHLPPGEYEFHAMAGGPAGVWQEARQELRLIVIPHFWERRAVQVAGALGLLAAVAATVWGLERGRSRRRLQQAEAQQAMERERRRIARDLHDDLGGDLTEIMLLGETAAQTDASAETVRTHAKAIAARSRQAAAAMDEIVWTVNPRNDTVPRLADRIAELARRLFDPLPVQLQIEIMEDIPSLPLPATARHAIFLAAKEAQNNAAKHSGATEVRVNVSCEHGRLVILVEDNGRGFDPAQQSGGRNGLENMRQRMESIGGTLHLKSAPGQGTQVRLEFAVPEAERNHR